MPLQGTPGPPHHDGEPGLQRDPARVGRIQHRSAWLSPSCPQRVRHGSFRGAV